MLTDRFKNSSVLAKIQKLAILLGCFLESCDPATVFISDKIQINAPFFLNGVPENIFSFYEVCIVENTTRYHYIVESNEITEMKISANNNHTQQINFSLEHGYQYFMCRIQRVRSQDVN